MGQCIRKKGQFKIQYSTDDMLMISLLNANDAAGFKNAVTWSQVKCNVFINQFLSQFSAVVVVEWLLQLSDFDLTSSQQLC